MKIIKRDLKKQSISLKIENLDDIWVLNQLIDPGDLIKGKTERKIKIGEGTDRNIKVVRKQFFLEVKAEKISISENSEILKVLGIITQGPDVISKGEHHSFNLEINSVFTITKQKWLKFQLQKLEESSKQTQPTILIVVFDREDAYFAKLKGEGFILMSNIKGDVQKKEEKHVSKDSFYKDISKQLDEYNKNDNYQTIIIASPGFWKESLAKVLSDEIKKKAVMATVSQANERGLTEVIKRDELQKVLEKNRASQETKIIDRLLQNISKDSACYGFKETKTKIYEGAVKDLILSYKYLKERREKDDFHELEEIMLACEKMDGKIHIISSEEPMQHLDSLTGIAGILRWKN